MLSGLNPDHSVLTPPFLHPTCRSDLYQKGEQRARTRDLRLCASISHARRELTRNYNCSTDATVRFGHEVPPRFINPNHLPASFRLAPNFLATVLTVTTQVAHERIKCVFFAHPRFRKKRVERGWFIMHEKRP